MLVLFCVHAVGIIATPSIVHPLCARSPSISMAWGPRRWLGQLVQRQGGAMAASPADAASPALIDRQLVQDTFDFFDVDHSGYVDAHELHCALKRYGVDVTEAGAQEVLVHYDTNPDGRLDREEFAQIVRDVASGIVVATSAPDAADHSADVYILDSLEVDADLLFDRLEAGCCIHCCTSLEPLVTQLLSNEAELRQSSPRNKLAEWRRNGQLVYAPAAEA